MQSDSEVYIEIDDNKILYIYDDLQLHIILTDKDIKSINNQPIENLLASLLKKKLEFIDIDQAIDIGGDLIPYLNKYCIVCGEDLEYPPEDKSFITCGRDKCQYESEEMILDNYLKDSFQNDLIVSKFLLESAYNAIKSDRRERIFEPFPTNFLLDDNIKSKIKRGEMTALNNSKIDINKYKDFQSLDLIIKQYSVPKIVEIIHKCKTDIEIAEKIGDKTYKLFKFIIKSNKTSIRPCAVITNFVIDTKYQNHYTKKNYQEDISNFLQFEVTHHPQIEDDFKQKVKTHGNLFLFHGSSYENWYSIMRNGLKICSNSKLMTAGAAHGTGIYLSNDINLSLGYTGGSTCIFGVYEVLNNPNKLYNSGTVFVAKDEKMLLLRYLFIPPSINFIRQLDLNKVLNDKFRNQIQHEKKAIVQKSNSLRTNRLLKEYKKITDLNPTKVGFYVELLEEDNLDIWRIMITNFDNNPKIKQDLIKLNIKAIEMEIRFPERYPIEPPFIRIVSPRFEYKTGHITSGGSICMELLTKSGWSPMYSIESLIIDIKCQIVEGDGKVDMQRWKYKYTLQEAQNSFYRVASSYGWIK